MVVAATPMLAFEAGTVDSVVVATVVTCSETVGVSMCRSYEGAPHHEPSQCSPDDGEPRQSARCSGERIFPPAWDR